MIARLDGELVAQIRAQVAVVIVMAGTNNLWYDGNSTYGNGSIKLASDRLKHKLQELHTGIQERVPAAKLVVMTIPQGKGLQDKGLDNVNRWLRSQYSNKDAQGLYLVDAEMIPYDAQDSNGHPLKFDETHFGPDGYRLFAELVAASGEEKTIARGLRVPSQFGLPMFH
jgi:lysophospholipase L1-like esterase